MHSPVELGPRVSGSAEPAAATLADATSGTPAITVRGLRKNYGSYQAVRGIDLDVAQGEILAFLGPNGAGKTTTVEILEGFRQRTEGEVRVLGVDPAERGRSLRGRVGVVLQESAPEARLTVAECLAMYAGYYERPLPVERALALVGLTGKQHDRCDRLSGGQLRRLDMALALIGDPELIFLDEPTTGFDPSARRSAWEVIAGLRELGKTIFLTTHYMDEAEALADRIVIIAAGRIVAAGTPATIGGRATEATTVSFMLPAGLTLADLPDLPEFPGLGEISLADPRDLPSLPDGAAAGHDGQVVVGRDGLVEITHPEHVPILHALTSWALEHGHPLTDMSVHRPSLEEIYLRLTREDS
jgi:ABC-2 type transport system ATP-binding protein